MQRLNLSQAGSCEVMLIVAFPSTPAVLAVQEVEHLANDLI
jgi:hypothetical protein